jgi:hypothetical protein
MYNCKICNTETSNDKNIRLSEDNGFSSSCYGISVCNSCLSDRFITDCGSSFLKIDEKLYVQYNQFGCYEMVASQRDIDRAFEPDRYEFQEWLNKVN